MKLTAHQVTGHNGLFQMPNQVLPSHPIELPQQGVLAHLEPPISGCKS